MKDCVYRGPQNVGVGEFVIIACDRNTEDLGIVVEQLSVEEYLGIRNNLKMQVTSQTAEETDIDEILRVASAEEKALLPAKSEDEAVMLNVRFTSLSLSCILISNF